MSEYPPQRNQHFQHGYEPFAGDSSLQSLGTTGPITFLNPTTSQFELTGWNKAILQAAVCKTPNDRVKPTEPHSSTHKTQSNPQLKSVDFDASFLWRSRDNRKGRHALLLRRRGRKPSSIICSIYPTNTFTATMLGLRAMVTVFPYWDISWVNAIIFALGAATWVVNGFFIVLPMFSSELLGQTDHISAWSAFVGGTLTLIGSALLMLEALNAYESGCFGWSLKRTIKGRYWKTDACAGSCYHHHSKHQTGHKHHAKQQDETGIVSNEEASILEYRGYNAETETEYKGRKQLWKWIPSWHTLYSHFIYEIGFVASAVQLCSATLFWMAKFIAIPEVLNRLSSPAIDGAYWTPEIIACVGFVFTSFLTMIETQRRWYVPAVSVLGWHIGLWKLVGSLGFLVCTTLGPLSQQGNERALFQSNLASFWGSWALLVGSMLQWYESLCKNPVIWEGTHEYSEWTRSWLDQSELK